MSVDLLIGIAIGMAIAILLQQTTRLLDKLTRPRYLIFLGLVVIILLWIAEVGMTHSA